MLDHPKSKPKKVFCFNSSSTPTGIPSSVDRKLQFGALVKLKSVSERTILRLRALKRISKQTGRQAFNRFHR